MDTNKCGCDVVVQIPGRLGIRRLSVGWLGVARLREVAAQCTRQNGVKPQQINSCRVIGGLRPIGVPMLEEMVEKLPIRLNKGKAVPITRTSFLA